MEPNAYFCNITCKSLNRYKVTIQECNGATERAKEHPLLYAFAVVDFNVTNL